MEMDMEIEMKKKRSSEKMYGIGLVWYGMVN